MTVLLSVKEAAERLGISAALMYALCEQRRIRHERRGLGRGTIRIPEDALNEYRRSVTVGAESVAAKQPPVPHAAEAARGTGGFTVLNAHKLHEAWAGRKATSSPEKT